jgi:hypothetical protein
MKVALLGATGLVYSVLLKEALDRGKLGPLKDDGVKSVAFLLLACTAISTRTGSFAEPRGQVECATASVRGPSSARMISPMSMATSRGSLTT